MQFGVDARRLDPARIAALAISLACQIGLVLLAFGVLDDTPESGHQNADEVITRVVLLQRETGEMPAMVAHRTTARTKPWQVPEPPARSVIDAPIAPSSASTPVTAELDLTVHGGPIKFGHDPLALQPPSSLDAPIRLRVRMTDASLGGRLQAMAQGQTCRELHAAMLRHPESLAAIRASLTRYGCDS